MEGHLKKLLGIKPKYQSDRLAICSQCPINIDEVCDKASGGCGCNLEAKTACKNCKCPIGKW